MTVGIDLRVLARGIFSGIEVYAAELTRAMLVRFPEVHFRLFHNAFKKSELPARIFELKNAEIIESRIPNKFFEYSSRVPFLPTPRIKTNAVDVLLSPHFLPPFSSLVPRATVVHDLSFVRYPEFFSLRKRYWHWLVNPKKHVARVDAVIAVSASTKADLCELWNIDSEKITVVHSGIDHSRFLPFAKNEPRVNAVRSKYDLPERFILFMGTLEPRKNILGLIQAFELFTHHSSLITHHLVIAGPRGWRDAPILQALRESPARGKIHYLGFVPEEEKPALYNLADLFVYPSFFEGFGLPPLEAMACGVPVIVSNRSSLPEVVGDSALMVEPYEIGKMSEAMAVMLEDARLRQYYREKAITRAGMFAWQKTAEEIMTVLRRTAKKKALV